MKKEKGGNEMKKAVKVLWISSNTSFKEYDPLTGEVENVQHMLIDPDEVYPVVEITGQVQVWPDVKPQIDRYEYKLVADPFDPDEEDIEEYLDRIVGEEGDIYADEYIEMPGDCLAYDHENNMFFSLSDLESLKGYRYWDGSNHREFVLDDYLGSDYQIEVVLVDSFDLDVWDGSNNYWPSRFSHARLWKLGTSDDITSGEASTQVLLETWTQFQDNHPVGELLSREDALRRLKEERHPEIDEIREWLND